ncbi:MAG TPA: glycoside hydrolase family 2 [Clostridiales bacterium]|nr:glycoside hydrolase family 2 [Clostridiales bacterium]
MFVSFFGGEPPKKFDVDLPHDIMIHKDRQADAISGGGGGFFPGESYNSTRQLFIPEEAQGDLIYLDFEGVYMYAQIEINSQTVAKHVNGYTGFKVKINEYLQYGKSNEIKVSIKNTCQPNSRWYSGSGLYRNVHLLRVPAFHIEPDGVRVTTLDADPDLATIRLSTDVQNASLQHRSGYVVSKILGAQGELIREVRSKINVFGGQRITVDQRVSLTDPRLWYVESPALYICETTLVDLTNSQIDSEVTTFGIRKLQLDTVHGLRINGQTVKLKGGCIHHDNGLLGSCAFEDAEERRVVLLKEAGYNAVRSAHNPISKAFLDACDRHGLLVMDEFTDTWTKTKADYDYAFSLTEWWEQDLEAMVRKDYNHPSVILYSIGNEIPECGSDFNAEWGRKFVSKIRSLDSTRFITNGINVLLAVMDRVGEIMAAIKSQSQEETSGGQGLNQMINDLGQMMGLLAIHPLSSQAIEESCDMLDVVGYNYSASRYELDHQSHPERICVGTETSPAALDENWELVKKHSYVLGDFSWTAWDYLGETGIGAINYKKDLDGKPSFMKGFPWIDAWCGDLDITGFRKPVSYWRETVWNGRSHQPYAAVQFPEHFGKTPVKGTWSFTDAISSWTWPGYEGMGIVVEAYADAEEAELLINGQSKGRIPVGDDFKKFYCQWKTTYEPGKLEIITYIGGQAVGYTDLRTAGEPGIVVMLEKEKVRAGSNDLCYLAIELRDADGVLNPATDRLLTVQVEGPAVLVGCGSADPKTLEKYCDNTHMTYYGRLQAIIRAGKESGTASVTVSADGMTSVTTEIAVV